MINYSNNDVIVAPDGSWLDCGPDILPPLTLRVRMVAGANPPMCIGATVTPVPGMSDIYDVCTAGDRETDWSELFYSESYLAEVLSANSVGVTDMHYMFSECYNLINVYPFDVTSVTNMNGTFGMCTGVISGALALYNRASSKAIPTSHDSTFYKCGESTVTGAAELAQIPSDWK